MVSRKVKMKILHYRSPSDPGPPPKVQTLKEGYQQFRDEESEKQFLAWLHTVGVKFMQLDDAQKIHTLDHLVNLSGSKQLIHLADVLPGLLYRDYIRLLPIEVSLEIFKYLDEKSLLNCCLVSRHWNNVIQSCREVWMMMSCRVGAKLTKAPIYPPQMYKGIFIKTARLIQRIKNKTAFDTMVLDGHRGRVMAIYYRDNTVATGSDDHTVRFWDIRTGDCLKVIHTHSVSALQFDEVYLYTASYDNTAVCWDTTSGQLLCRYMGHTSAVFSLDARREMDIIITGSADKTIKIWQLSTSLLFRTLTDWHTSWVTRVRILSFTPSILGFGTLQIASTDKQGCCFWTVSNDDRVEVSVTHSADWCMSIPCITKQDCTSVCTWNQRDRVQSVFTYNIETVNGKCIPSHVSSVAMPTDLPAKQTVLGLGRKFAVFAVDDGYSRLALVDVCSSRIMCSVTVPPFRPTQNGASATLGEVDWLDGFTDNNRHGLFLALCLKDNCILMMKWKD